jgi:C1A family cysteine protease
MYFFLDLEMAGLMKGYIPIVKEAKHTKKVPFSNDPLKQEDNINLLPLSVDWRTARGGKVTPVKNQGQCADSWAFATTALYESFLMIGGMD